MDEERHNFALAKDGAKVVGANKEARKPESVLDSDGDTFLKNECKADKWLIIELSQVTKIDMLRLSQVRFDISLLLPILHYLHGLSPDRLDARLI